MSRYACPEDEAVLVPISLERVEGTVQQCETCHGAWLDRELIERLSRTLRSEPRPPSAVGLPADVRGTVPVHPRVYRPCPVCGALMDVKHGGGVAVDICREHGVWFDGGELAPFIAWAKGGMPRSGTHHASLPLAGYLGVGVPAASAPAGAGSGGLEILGGVLEGTLGILELIGDITSW